MMAISVHSEHIVVRVHVEVVRVYSHSYATKCVARREWELHLELEGGRDREEKHQTHHLHSGH